MRFPHATLTGASVLGTMLAIASLQSANANGARRPIAMPAQSPRTSALRQPFARQRDRTVTTCSADYPTAGDYFVGVSEGSDIAGGQTSAVAGGSSNEACGVGSAIGAGSNNLVRAGTGSNTSFIGAGYANQTASTQAMVGAGEFNFAGGAASFVGSGAANDATGAGAFVGAGGTAYEGAQGGDDGEPGNLASGIDSFVGAGDLNVASGNGSFIGAGGYLYASGSSKPATPGNQASGADSFIGAGDNNVVAANESFIGAGASNTIAAAATYSSILGGAKNTVSGEYASVLGGYGNTASGSYAIVAGGNGNTAAGTLSFAAGYHADASHNGSFVWSDYSSGSTPVEDSAANQFVVRASGGVYIYSSEAQSSGEELAPGSGTWASLSDRNAKFDIVPLDDASILARVATLPIASWRYKTERGVRHVGPMAQDFYAAFGTGTDDRHITSIDEDGVALAAIKAVNAKLTDDNVRVRRENERLQDELVRDHARFQTSIARLEADVRTLAAHRDAQR